MSLLRNTLKKAGITESGTFSCKMSLSRCGALLSFAVVRLLVPGVRATTTLAKSSSCPSSSTLPGKNIMYIAEERGSAYAPDFRVFFRDECGPISPLHDIPLWADQANRIANMIVEVPRWTNAKMELSLSEALNPIKQDVKKGQLRFVANVFPHHGYIWNYGALPQTWENPQHIDGGTQARGDNDPIDVIEIGSRVASRGDVVQVKIVGTIALIDEGETDWKLIAIDTKDPLSGNLNDIQDVETHFPGLLKATVEWFRLYKIPDGKPPNQFAFNGEAKNKEFAHKVIDEVHEFWKTLVNGDSSVAPEINKTNVSVMTSPHRVERSDAAAALSRAPLHSLPQPIPPSVNKWHFLSNV